MASKAVEPDLSRKEKEMFGQIVTCYEKKDYTKGIKLADTILKKHPNHGETQAMKGLLKNCQGQKEEAYDLCKLGLRNNMRSHICWHVYGLIYRSDNNYKEASKCYLNALRWYADNQNILRDLSWLQIHLRDYAGFITTREKILKSKPSLRTSWVGAALAFSLAGDYMKAFDLVAKSKEALAAEPVAPYEESELLLFQNQCLEKDGQYLAALEHLKLITPQVVDKLSVRVKEAELLLLSGDFESSKQAWLRLVVEQSDNYRFHCGLQTAYLELEQSRAKEMLALSRLDLPSTRLALSDSQRKVLLDLYRSGAFKSPKKVELTLVGQGEEFHSMLDAHMKKSLRSGIPALYHDVCALVSQPSPHDAFVLVLAKDSVDFRSHPVTQIALGLVTEYISTLRSNNTFECAPAAGTEVEAPTALLWAMFLHAHLLERCGNLQLALSVIDECISHTPTAPDMHLKRARILKQCGSLQQAAEACDEGRALDLQDRYLNNKATKYFLRADYVSRGVATIALFTKHEGDPQSYLAEMQCNWFELEAGESHCRAKNWSMALKKFHSVQKHFKDYVEDMFDFHGFCIRKSGLRCHADAVQMQDSVFAHKFYQRACRGALRVYLHLIDEPEDIDGLGHLGKDERRKERARRKKAKAKEAKAEEAKELAAKEEAKWSGKDSKMPALAKDSDPWGDKLIFAGEGKNRNYLEEAQLWCASISQRLSSSDPETLALYIEVQLRRGKAVTATRALVRGFSSYPAHPALSVMLVKTCQRVGPLACCAGAGADMLKSAHVKEAVLGELEALLGPSSNGVPPLQAYVSRVVEASKSTQGNLPMRVSAAQCVLLLHGCNTSANNAAEAEIVSAREEAAGLLDCDELWAGRGITVVNAIAALKMITTELCVPPQVGALSPRIAALPDSFRSKFLGVFPLSLLPTLPGDDAESTQVPENAFYDDGM